ncbi:MAG: hypothetical protein L6R36_003703 [Xanthoria steineri]|nr:MAG: hypothetical protein L6R36_003703 [Xanthoria steineri]
MALDPKFAGQVYSAEVSPKAIHTLELFLDYVCPYSAKMFLTLASSVLPLLPEKYPGKLQLIFRQQIQPWHPSSTLTHEAGVAVLRLAPEKFYPFSRTLFERQKEFFDVSVVKETRNETYRRLARLAGEVGVDEKEVYGLLEVGEKAGEDGGLNGGNGVTDDVKVLVKVNRLTGVHVTPTVLFNGVEENSISSSFTGEQWKKWLEENIK